MIDCLEKEKAIGCLGLDQHDDACSDDIEEDDDVDDTNSVENNVSWTSQGLSKFAHHDCGFCWSNAMRFKIFQVLESLAA